MMFSFSHQHAYYSITFTPFRCCYKGSCELDVPCLVEGYQSPIVITGPQFCIHSTLGFMTRTGLGQMVSHSRSTHVIQSNYQQHNEKEKEMPFFLVYFSLQH
jgi:hypothetical protein